MGQFGQKRDIVFADIEVKPGRNTVEDIGAVRASIPVRSANGIRFHSGSMSEFEDFLRGADFLCGHNIIDFDLNYIGDQAERAGAGTVIDTLCLSALLFPQKPYHRLLKDDKLQAEELNNPLNDAVKAMELFMDEVAAFSRLPFSIKKIYDTLLSAAPGFGGFFSYVGFHEKTDCLSQDIHIQFENRICENAYIGELAAEYPTELSYCLAAISANGKDSIIPYWVQKKYPKVQEVYRRLRGIPCREGCSYCRENFNIYRQLEMKFGYRSFRKYDGEPLQERAVQAAVDGRSLLAIFPTGGGKSITFQLPALMAADTMRGLTVVISPLQSLMKDQVDNLSRLGITDAVTINGLLNTVERAEAIERIESGMASILYISPESLRSKTIERLLMGRNVVRFVIDEAHCFSSWGQDFRVDYLYIGDFIAKLREKKQTEIPVSCFTATAKQKVVSDIREYFKQKLGLELELFSTDATRANLRYEVLYRENDAEKYATLRNLIEQKDCPTIVYASRTKRTVELARKLYADGFNARAFHGKMGSEEKIANQEAFIQGEVQIIVATSAFGMGVDKKDVRLVVHYDISDSLENYVQEAGRAGRDENIQAECYVLFNEDDLDKHFILLNQTKLSIGEIQQVWKGVKELTRERSRVSCSALEIARKAGWDESVSDIETKVKTAISALETSGYVKRGQNCPRVYADSIQVKNAQEAVERINASDRFDSRQKEYAVRIIKKLISTRSRARGTDHEAESRVDYIADHLGIEKKTVIEMVNLMREEKLLANDREMCVYVEQSALRAHAKSTVLGKFLKLEIFLLGLLKEEGQRVNYKMVNEEAQKQGLRFSSVSSMKTIFYFWTIKGYIAKPEGELGNTILLRPLKPVEQLKQRYEKRVRLTAFIEEFFVERAREINLQQGDGDRGYVTVSFSIQEIKQAYLAKSRQPGFDADMQNTGTEDVPLREVEEALLYLSKINAFRLEGGFLVLYNGMEITRLVKDNKIRYKLEDYRQLQEFYQSKTQQIHIVGEYANMMVQDYQAALTFVNDYFQMEYKLFLTKYFKGARLSEINRNITPMKYQKLFENLSPRQAEIISDDASRVIVVAAGPGSGKTMILVHKLASLMLLEDVKHEQLLMLTFSRAAAMEFKVRLKELIGNAAYFVEIKTFHSYCFDLLGKVGNLESSDNVVRDAARMIESGEAELDRITKNVLVLDEAQDMDAEESRLVRALMERNEDMRVIAVGDDDQNIYEFRGSDSKYMTEFLKETGAKKYELVDNYRSSRNVIKLANEFAKTLDNRMKAEMIRGIKEEIGCVMLVNVKSYLEMSMLKVLKNTSVPETQRTAAVLTTTNDQAYLVAELLDKNGYRARLVQSNDGFPLRNLAEVRYFLKQLENGEPVICDEAWNRAWEQMERTFARSKNLNACRKIFLRFENEYEKKYYTDLITFLQEMRFEDFYQCEKGEICVSTIHKAKGREYDAVYMLVSGAEKMDSQQQRSIYVGITRARSELYLFYNTWYFERLRSTCQGKGIFWYKDSDVYPEPEEIVLSFSYGDVWLEFFKAKNRPAFIEEVQSGDMLRFTEEKRTGRLLFEAKLEGGWQQVTCSSKNSYKKYRKRREKGYVITEARVQFVASWWKKETEEEWDIVLPVLRMRKDKAKR